MMQKFEEMYNEYKGIRYDYSVAKEADNEQGKLDARAQMKDFNEEVNAQSKEFIEIFNDYIFAREHDNEYIDISSNFRSNNVEAFITSLREFGIGHFTLSSGWSTEMSWLFLQHGCSLDGMVEINDNCTSFDSDEYDKKPAYLFGVH